LRVGGHAAVIPLSFRTGSVTQYDDATLAALACVVRERAREFVEAKLGQLANGDAHSRRFMATLCFHLEENMSPLRARSARVTPV